MRNSAQLLPAGAGDVSCELKHMLPPVTAKCWSRVQFSLRMPFLPDPTFPHPSQRCPCQGSSHFCERWVLQAAGAPVDP